MQDLIILAVNKFGRYNCEKLQNIPYVIDAVYKFALKLLTYSSIRVIMSYNMG